MAHRARWRSLAGIVAGGSIMTLVVACSSSSSGGGGASCTGTLGGPVAGPHDNHCALPDGGMIIQNTSAAACTADASAPAMGDAGVADAGNIGNCGDPGFGATRYGTAGADDDCKYDVSWTSTDICRNVPVYFTVTATHRVDGKPLTGAGVVPDVVLSCTHPIPNSPAPADPSPEVSPGKYTVGPMVFDEQGKWVVRFHFDGNCADAPASPHGHAAFWVQVP